MGVWGVVSAVGGGSHESGPRVSHLCLARSGVEDRQPEDTVRGHTDPAGTGGRGAQGPSTKQRPAGPHHKHPPATVRLPANSHNQGCHPVLYNSWKPTHWPIVLHDTIPKGGLGLFEKQIIIPHGSVIARILKH